MKESPARGRTVRRIARSASTAVLAVALTLAFPSRSSTHEVPAEVTVRAFVAPEDGRLRLLVRVPLEAMRDIEFPLRGPGYLDIERADSAIHAAARLWIAGYIDMYEGGTRLGPPEVTAVRLSLPSDPSFRRYDDAIAHVAGPRLPEDTDLPWQQALLDVLLEYPIESEHARFSIDPALAHLGLETLTVVRFRPPDGAERAFQFSGNPGRVHLDPRWHQAALRFVESGFRHILGGIDHLLFLLCLVIPFRRLGPLVPVVTSFTVAHSITLIASALGLAPGALWFPPLVETLIALSIVYMAFENIVGAKLRHRWLVAFGFGLVHGFGFSFLLRETLQFAGSHLATSLLAFNVGVELGQLFLLGLVVPALNALFRYVVAERLGGILLSALVAHSAWHWMGERAAELRRHSFQWPAFDAALLASAMRWLMLLLILAGAVWLLFELFGRAPERGRDGKAAAGAEN